MILPVKPLIPYDEYVNLKFEFFREQWTVRYDADARLWTVRSGQIYVDSNFSLSVAAQPGDPRHEAVIQEEGGPFSVRIMNAKSGVEGESTSSPTATR